MTSFRFSLLGAAAAAAACLAASTASIATAPDRSLVVLRAGAPASANAALRVAGARRVDSALRLWEVSGESGKRVVARLRSGGSLASVSAVRTYSATETPAVPDPLLPDEWWRSAVGIDGLEPPGPGVPVTVVDSGVYLAHPEFVGRPDLVALNPQEPAPYGGEHGTMVTSVIGAPSNGVGVVGIYPRASIRSWDTALGDGQSLDSVQIVEGILGAVRAGKSVINLSLGGERDPAISLAIDEAVARGSLVVAASGNEGEEGSPLSWPASDRHVLTVAATDSSSQVTGFSSRSPYVDLAAPGQDIMVASAISGSWLPESGTSFSAPIVSGAAAWLWTVRPELDASQVAEILRLTAHDIGAPGRDVDSGYGLLNVAAALTAPAPTADAGEPNDTIAEVTPAAATNRAHAPALTSPTRRVGSVVASEDRYEDPTDVYRVWIPARRTLTVTVRSSGDNDLVLSSGGTAPRRLGTATTRGSLERLTYASGKTGRTAYVKVTLAAGTIGSTYSLAARVG